MFRAVVSFFKSIVRFFVIEPLPGRICKWCKGVIALDASFRPIPLCPHCLDGAGDPGAKARAWERAFDEFPAEFRAWAARLQQWRSPEDIHRTIFEDASQALTESSALHRQAYDLIRSSKPEDQAKGAELVKQANALKAEGERILSAMPKSEVA